MAPVSIPTGPGYVEDPLRKLTYFFSEEGNRLRVEVWVHPGGDMPEHIHPNQDEWFEILEGEVFLSVDGKRRVAHAGERDTVPKGVTHGYYSTGEACHLVVEAEPPSRLQDFLEQAAEMAKAGLYDRRGVPSGPRAGLHLAEFAYRNRDVAVVISPPRLLQSVFFPPLAAVERGLRALGIGKPAFPPQ
jgi:quercetin dioxygenase-like cupin family protein